MALGVRARRARPAAAAAIGTIMTGCLIAWPAAAGHSAANGDAVDRGAVDRGAVDRGAVDRGALDRGPVDRVAADRGAVDRDAKVAFKVSDPRITESSGLAVSKRHRGVVYTHNDSGGTPKVFALGPDGRTRATITLGGATARDWEGMAMGRDEAGRPALYVADIGDNMGGAWPYVTVYRIPEPASLRDRTVRATAFRLKYADGPRNAEAVLIDPKTNRLYVASKLFSGALYAAPAKLRAGRTNTLRKAGNAPAIATDGAFSPDGRTFTIRTYFAAHVYAFSGGKPGDVLEVVDLPAQEQGESITYAADGRSLLAGSEGGGQPVWRIPLPKEALPAGDSGGAGGDGAPAAAGGDGDGRRDNTGTALALFATLAVGAAVGYGILRRRA